MALDKGVESWTWYGFASAIFVLRYISRGVRIGSWRFVELEDIVMVFAFAFYTNFIVLVNVQSKHPFTNILPPTGTAGMTQAQLDDRVYGAKVTFALEESMVMIQVLTKTCMNLLFLKLTAGLRRQLWVKIVTGYVIGGWLITEIFFFGVWCRPFHNYFRVFDDNSGGCTTAQHHLIMSFTFNLSADILMLTIPVPMLIASQLPLRQKLTVTGIFSLGIFVIIAAAMSRYYTFAHPESILWIFWYVREASTAVIVANAPHLYALLRKIFDLEKFGTLVRRTKAASRLPRYGRSVELKEQPGSGSSHKRSMGRTESTENFATNSGAPLHIWQRTEYSVNENTASELQWEDRELHSVWRGGMGTKAVIVSDSKRTRSDSS